MLKEIEIPFCRKCPPVFEDQILTISLHDTRSWCYDNVPEDANHTLFDREWNIYFKNYERPVNAGPFEVFVSPKDSSLAAWEAGSKGSNLLLQKVILDFLDNLITPKYENFVHNEAGINDDLVNKIRASNYIPTVGKA